MDFFSPKPNIASERSILLKQAVRDRFALPEAAIVRLIELQCTEEGCPPLETVVAILSSEGNRQYKIHKALAEVSPEDIASLH